LSQGRWRVNGYFINSLRAGAGGLPHIGQAISRYRWAIGGSKAREDETRKENVPRNGPWGVVAELFVA
jgi:hypothetical protein